MAKFGAIWHLIEHQSPEYPQNIPRLANPFRTVLALVARDGLPTVLSNPCASARRFGWTNIRGARLVYRREKTRTKTDTVVDIPLLSALAAVLATLPRDRLTFLAIAGGAQRSSNGLGNQMRKWRDAAGLPECTAHGLRKAIARRLAEAGASPHEIMAVTGHSTLKEVERYARAAGRPGLADRGLERLREADEKVTVLLKRAERAEPAKG